MGDVDPTVRVSPTPSAERSVEEEAVVFGDPSAPLIGILHVPAVEPRQVVMVVPGGSQNRAGNGRQFVSLARHLSAKGIGVLRFDYAGMADSRGALPHFDSAYSSLHAATTFLADRFPQARALVSWGLCDGATAALLHAAADDRIRGVIAANPWARSAGGQSHALVHTHYAKRLKSREFWVRVLRGEVKVVGALGEAFGHVARSIGSRLRTAVARRADGSAAMDVAHLFERSTPLPERLALALSGRPFDSLILIARQDLTGAEFDVSLGARVALGRPGIERVFFDDADHVFSARSDWQRVLDESSRWLLEL